MGSIADSHPIFVSGILNITHNAHFRWYNFRIPHICLQERKMYSKNKYATAQLSALWELVWIIASVIGYSDPARPWLFPLAATLASAPAVALAVFFASVKLSVFMNRKEAKK